MKFINGIELSKRFHFEFIEPLISRYFPDLRYASALITDRIDEEVTLFYDRPFRVIQGSKFAQTIAKSITDPTIRKLNEKRLIGGIDQITDNTDYRLINQWCNSENSKQRNILRLVFDKILE
ncbi:hypothetical protein AMS62_20115 [Bacillus sp. FJAT-18019]|nr:hypothetical protein AMS62_20115 [Bacillus sp. FJAT-18019]